MRRSQVNIVSSNAKCPDALSWFSTAEAFSSIVNEASGILGNLPSGFAGTLEYHLKRLRITNSKLVMLTNLSLPTVTRYRTDNDMHRKLSVVVLICLALKLNPILSLDLIKKAGFSFTCSVEHTAYQMLLMSSPILEIEQCNEYLISLGLKPLSTI